MGKKPDRTRPPDLTVFADETIDSKGMSIADVLAEPPKQSGLWIGAVARRLIAASARPVALAPIDRKFIERIETAGWFVASRDADTTNARDSCWPSDGALKRIGVGVGNPRPQLVIVGERVSREGQVPFHSRSGAWLFLALRLLGYDELSVYCVNAYSSTRKERFERLRDLRKTFDKFGVDAPWVSFGEGAHIALRQLGMPAREVVSPAYHKKMNQNEGPEGFAELIMKSGIDYGPWHGKTLPVVPVDELADIELPYDIGSAAFRAGYSTARDSASTGRPGTSGGSISREKIEIAHRIFLEDPDMSIARAAKEAGVSSHTLYSISRREGWADERMEYARQKTAKAKKSSIEAEAYWASESRKLAWEATHEALKSCVEALKAGEYKPVAKDVKSLADTAITLSKHVVGPDETRPELEGRTLRDLVTEVSKRIEDGLGGGM